MIHIIEEQHDFIVKPVRIKKTIIWERFKHAHTMNAHAPIVQLHRGHPHTLWPPPPVPLPLGYLEASPRRPSQNNTLKSWLSVQNQLCCLTSASLARDRSMLETSCPHGFPAVLAEERGRGPGHRAPAEPSYLPNV